MLAKPVLRWAGGKTWLLNKIDRFLPNSVGRYFEPFVGSASVFLSLRQRGCAKTARLSDANSELIEFYKVLQDHPSEVADLVSTYQNTKEFYYDIRKSSASSPIEAAARFYFLNRTSFNGIYRVNLDGMYNVPYGNKKYSQLVNNEAFIAFSESVRDVEFAVGDFESILPLVNAGDFIYLDPPYTTAHNENGFIKYNQKLFSFDDQIRLCSMLTKLTQVGANYMLSNAHHKNILELFGSTSNVFEVSRYSSIAGNKQSRHYVSEYIFTNYEVKG